MQLSSSSVFVIIPAFNEQQAIGSVIKEIPTFVEEIVVVDNGSTDDTASAAARAGATVIGQPAPGYGNACLKGIEFLKAKREPPGIVVFIDGDNSDYPAEMKFLVDKIIKENFDLVIGSRELGKREPGSMTVAQIFGNRLATFLLWKLYKVKFTDLGPFRAVKWDCLLKMDMQDKTYGWTVEMQVKAAKLKMKTTEVPVRYRKRIGFSKISGTVRGTVLAGYKIITTIFKYM